MAPCIGELLNFEGSYIFPSSQIGYCFEFTIKIFFQLLNRCRSSIHWLLFISLHMFTFVSYCQVCLSPFDVYIDHFTFIYFLKCWNYFQSGPCPGNWSKYIICLSIISMLVVLKYWILLFRWCSYFWFCLV